jgi:hypothetical protein
MEKEKAFKCRLRGENLGKLTLAEIDQLPPADREVVEAEIEPGVWARPSRWQGQDEDIEVIL